MGNISTYLQQIMNAVYGEQVRSAIHDAINQCYLDASAGITPTIVITAVDGGTRVDITVGATTTSFTVLNGTATTQEVQYYVTEWLEENPDFYTTEVELLSGYIDDLATTGTYTKKNFYRCTSGRNSGTTITENSKQAYVVLTQEEATAHSIIYNNGVYSVEVIKVRDGSVISQSAFVTTSPVPYLDGTYDTAIINFKRQDEADLTAMERRLTLFYESSVGGVALASDLDDKVDKVTGKGLSTEDYTTVEKNKLAGLTQVVIDDTLSVEGRAADAKETGKRLLHIPITHIFNSEPELQGFVVGAVKSVGTLDNSSTTRIRTSNWLDLESIISISASNDQLALYAYSDVAPSPGSTYFIGGWNGSSFGTAAYVSSLDIQSIKSDYPDYKLILVVRYSDNRTVFDVDDLISEITFTLKATPLNDVIDGINNRINGIEEDITVPFDFQIPITISKTKAGYATDVVTQKYAYTKANGKTIFVSPSGDDTNTGMTVISPLKTLEAALAVTDVATIILLSGTYESGVNFTAEMSVNIPINFIGVGEVIIHNNGKPIVFNNTVYMYGIIFDGGTQNALTINHGAGVYAVFERCTFRNARYYNGIQINGGCAILKNCKAYSNAYDGFNYHANNGVIVYALEVDCESYDNGHTSFSLESGQSSNASTSHDNCPIVRVNGTYYGCHGGVVADKDCNSANYGCTAGVSTVTDEANYPDRMSNYWASGAMMYLYDCVSYGSKYDTAAIRSGSIVSNVEYASNYTG